MFSVLQRQLLWTVLALDVLQIEMKRDAAENKYSFTLQHGTMCTITMHHGTFTFYHDTFTMYHGTVRNIIMFMNGWIEIYKQCYLC